MWKVLRYLFFCLYPALLCAHIRPFNTDVLGYFHDQKPIVVVIPSYNNRRYYKQNIDSVLEQNYNNYSVIYIDDCSSDGTGDLVENYIAEHGASDCWTIIHNQDRHGALYNLYHAIHSCDDNKIIVTLDGDDQLAHTGVLAYINDVYASSEDVWLTYGQFLEIPHKRVGFCAPFPEEVIRNNSFRAHGMPVSHLRTFYAWLFKKIEKDDLMYQGSFYSMTWDKAMMAPMIEMCGGRFVCIDEVLYLYNYENPIADVRKNGALQVKLRDHIYKQKPYEPLKEVVIR